MEFPVRGRLAGQKTATEKLFSEIENGKYAIFVSEIVMREIYDAEISIRTKLVNQIIRYQPVVLEEDSEVLELVQHYLANQLLSDRQLADMGHAAVASINEMDILVSWNMRHIVKRKTKVMVNALNQIRGYRPIEICTPEEVIENDNDE